MKRISTHYVCTIYPNERGLAAIRDIRKTVKVLNRDLGRVFGDYRYRVKLCARLGRGSCYAYIYKAKTNHYGTPGSGYSTIALKHARFIDVYIYGVRTFT